VSELLPSSLNRDVRVVWRCGPAFRHGGFKSAAFVGGHLIERTDRFGSDDGSG
jgi:hypothetical protein